MPRTAQASALDIPASGAAIIASRSRTFPASENCVSLEAQQIVEEVFRIGLSMPETISHSEIALVEVLNNIVEHAYAKYDGEIAVTWMLTEDEVIFETRDTGRPMPQLQPPNSECPPNDVELDELPEGGFGWFLIRKLSRRLTYERCGPENVVKFAIPRVL